MDPTITTILQVGFGGVGAIIITKFFESWTAARQGKKEALDTLRESRAKYRRLYLDWRDYAYHVRAVARDHGVPRDDLGNPPQDE
ncbi:MAG TPA: hypothetical protein VIG71_10835 [Enteractinococcus sp.]